MYSKIKTRREDQHAQRSLWRNGDQSQPIEEYTVTSLIFGAVCIAEYIKKNASKFNAQFPDAAHRIIIKYYIDNLVVSFSERKSSVAKNNSLFQDVTRHS